MSLIWGELEQKVEATLKDAADNIVNWKPTSDMYVEDIVKIDDGKAFIPFDIRYELENGDMIICITQHEEPEIEINRSEERCKDCVYYVLYAKQFRSPTYPEDICEAMCGDK